MPVLNHYTRHILGIDSGVQSHPKATPKPHQGHTKATPRPHQGYTKATPRLHQGHTKATPRPHQGHTKATPRPHQGHPKATLMRPESHLKARCKLSDVGERNVQGGFPAFEPLWESRSAAGEPQRRAENFPPCQARAVAARLMQARARSRCG